MLELAAATGEIDLKYLDESRFCVWSNSSYYVCIIALFVAPSDSKHQFGGIFDNAFGDAVD